jgi:hypothetical protein
MVTANKKSIDQMVLQQTLIGQKSQQRGSVANIDYRSKTFFYVSSSQILQIESSPSLQNQQQQHRRWDSRKYLQTSYRRSVRKRAASKI